VLRLRLFKITKVETTMKAFRSFIGPAVRWSLTVALISIFSCATPAQTPTSTATPAPARRAQRPFPPTQYIPAHDYDQRNIKLDLRFDWEHEQAIGTATITLAPLVKDLRQIDFDAAYMTVSSAALSSGGTLNFAYDETREKLSVTLDRPYQPLEELTVIISYHTNQPPLEKRSNLGGGGLNFIKPRPDDPTRPQQIWSQGEAEFNHLWFPCFDHPSDFATSEMVATVEKPLSVISNGKLVEVRENSDGTRTFDWKIDEPHATYLTSIIVGDFVPVTGEYNGIPIVTNVYSNEVLEGKVTAARLPEMVRFFSEKTGVKYPYAKYAQTTVRDFGGGMENISATTQTDNMIHDARTELDATSDGLQSHELAHQWFGDLITCRHWSDIWLNESFATYFQAMWDEHSLGRDDFLYLDVRANKESYYETWARGQRRPIVTKNYSDPDAVFDTYAYPRGGAVLHMLRTILGEDNWWRSINHYLTKYAHQPVETEQFRIAIEETTGQPMDWFFEQWLYKMGHPIFRVTQDYDPAKKTLMLTVTQEQRPDPESQYPQVTYFQTPVDIEIGTASGTRIERVQIVAKEEQTFTLAVDSEPLLVNFDYGDPLIKELIFIKTTGQLVYQAAHDQDVLGRIWALKQLATRMNDTKTASGDRQSIVKAIEDAATNDQFWGTRLEAVTSLTGSKEAKDALLTATRDKNARVRVRAVSALAATKDPSLATVYQQFLNDPSYAVIRAAAFAFGETKNPSAYNELTRLIDVPSWRETIRASALSGLEALGDKRALELGFKYSAAGNPNGVRASALGLLGATGKDDPRTFAIITATFNEGFERRNFALMFGAADALVGLGDERGLAVFQEMSKKAAASQRIVSGISAFEGRLRAKLAPARSNR
jgi:aminopeptidase N